MGRIVGIVNVASNKTKMVSPSDRVTLPYDRGANLA